VNDLNKFHTELQSHRACLQAPYRNFGKISFAY
jgi:hypothetical protein